MSRFLQIAVLIGLMASGAAARADEPKVRILTGKPLGYLTLQVMQHYRILEKQAEAQGLPGFKADFIASLTGTNAVDALLSGSVDVVQYSPDVLITLWSKTVGTPQEVKGIIGKGAVEEVLITRNPNVRTIGDFTDKDRIAVGGVKVSAVAMELEMEAARVFGEAEWEKLDPIMVTSGAPDGHAQLMSPLSPITAFFSVPPYTYLELEQPGFHRVLSSYEVMGPHSSAVEFTTKRFHDANPKLMAAFVAAMKEASDIILHDRERAFAAYFALSGDTTTRREILEKFLEDPRTEFDLAPRGVMKFADFMFKHGLIQRKPESWKDLFFPEAHSFDGG